ncbi:hypothetical protein Tco_0619627 [Tanacetum coccineum]
MEALVDAQIEVYGVDNEEEDDEVECFSERLETSSNFFMHLLRLIEQGILSLEEKIVILLRRSGNVVSLVIKWLKRA